MKLEWLLSIFIVAVVSGAAVTHPDPPSYHGRFIRNTGTRKEFRICHPEDLLEECNETAQLLRTEEWREHCPKIIPKKLWNARKPVQVDYAIVPVENVVIHHTLTAQCNSESSCSNSLKSIQDVHMDTWKYHDIGYNFMIGGDGNVYEGAGWHKIGQSGGEFALEYKHCSKCFILAFIGTFIVLPTF